MRGCKHIITPEQGTVQFTVAATGYSSCPWCEIERLTLENWQLKGALGYPVPGDIPEGDFKCGLCDARRKSDNEQLAREEK